ncbi:Coiled-coil domain-containing protein 77 [Hondaea fermentalgiana]|uniref:Coiled-coil domain-containing protein 77 n=1 Tax=Hondaea fermentalgiana TaxID=2315210 RepID=A0A2R5GGA5_9STRA|nr:Coiled-coil domain-containing protein 77 [Hondaea fermentalgiana]|eukprot:GBG27683.1 Coiled-coil domain-containing protein 77 [Hondaea fermentalgiana]
MEARETLGDGRDGAAIVQSALRAAKAAQDSRESGKGRDEGEGEAAGPGTKRTTRTTAETTAETRTTTTTTTTQGLLAFYRTRLDEVEKEREELLRRVGASEVPHAELHRVKWELKVRQEEVEQLQNALSDANVQLFEEREEALKLLAENDELKLQQSEDRRRIQHLLALTEPVSQEVTFFKDCRPYLMTRNLSGTSRSSATERGATAAAAAAAAAGNGSSSAASRVHDIQGGGKDTGGVQVVPNAKLMARGSKDAAGSKVLRTIYLPNEQTETLTKRVDALEKQLEQQQRVSRDRIAALERDRVDREAQHKRTKDGLTKQIEALEQRLLYSEQATRAATKDYLELRHSSHTESRQSVERLARLDQDNKVLRTQLDTIADRVAQEMEAARQSILRDAEASVQRFRRQAMQAEDQLVKLKHQKEHVSRDLRDKAMSLGDRNLALTKKNRHLEQRRKLDHEGFLRDIAALRKEVQALERLAYGPGPDTDAYLPDENYLAGANVLESEIDALKARIEHLKPSLAASKTAI